MTEKSSEKVLFGGAKYVSIGTGSKIYLTYIQRLVFLGLDII